MELGLHNKGRGHDRTRAILVLKVFILYFDYITSNAAFSPTTMTPNVPYKFLALGQASLFFDLKFKDRPDLIVFRTAQ